MRILVATTHTVPGFSGGWTTPLDLFGDRHQASYVIGRHPAESTTVEGISVTGAGITGFLARPWKRKDHVRQLITRWKFRSAVRREFHRFRADMVLCLDQLAGLAAMENALPFACRFHSTIRKEYKDGTLERLLKNALFATSCHTTGDDGLERIPHNQDLSRFSYIEPERPERVVLLTSIDDVHEPELFIEGVMGSKHIKGDIVGTGPRRGEIEKLCAATGGKVRCLPPVPRLEIPGLLKGYQIGAATVRRIDPVVYQMKVNAYMASGLYTVVKPWTHIAVEAPELVSTFVTPGELATTLDRLHDQWEDTLDTRRRANEWIRKNYSVEIPRERFEQLLSRAFD